MAAHGAEGLRQLGNSRAAVRAAVAAGVAVIEMDLRQSSDRQVYVFHDAKLEESTTGSGRIEQQPAAVIERARLSNGESLHPDVIAQSRTVSRRTARSTT